MIESRYGTRFSIRPDKMYQDLFLFGEYEEVHTRVFKALIRPGDVVMDIGANFGWYTAAFARWVGLHGQVHAFEPVPFTGDLTAETIGLNDSADVVRLNRIGLGDAEGAFTIYTFAGLSHGYASMGTLGRDDAIAHECQVSTLDTYVSEAGLPGVHFIKLDVEGHELAVLQGGRDLLTDACGPIVAFETNTECLSDRGLSGADLEALFRECGYTHFWSIERHGAIRRNATVETRDCDFIAAPPRRVGEVEKALDRCGVPYE